MGKPPSHHGSIFDICSVEGRGNAVLAARDLKPNELVLQESSLLTVKTFMILNGVVVWRRSKVEAAYEGLSAADRQRYRQLSPVSLSESDAVTSDKSSHALRHRGLQKEAEVEPVEEMHPTLTQHRQIWDRNGFHFCDDEDVRKNRILHLGVSPTLLSMVVGSLYAFWFNGSYMKCILGAAVLFFTVLGPISVRIFYMGSQSIFLQAARLNHSCVPNAAWSVDGQQAPLGGSTLDAAGGTDSAPKLAESMSLSVQTNQAVAEGAELTIDYIRDLSHLDPLERRKLLFEEYDFHCKCDRCETAASKKSHREDEAEES